MSALVLGTAQFGAAYGATNTRGRLDDGEVSSMLEQATAAGVNTFDTAADYGDAQLRLGRLAPRGSRFITKFSLPAENVDPSATSIFDHSRETLRVPGLAGVLFHRLSDLRDHRLPDALEILRAARNDGTAERIGVSIYDADDLGIALEVFPDLDLVQLPANILDRRLLNDDRIAELHQRGVMIHVRSVYLQGVLLAETEQLRPHFAPFKPALDALRGLARANRVSTAAILLGFLRDHPLVDGVIVGAAGTDELAVTLEAWNTPIPHVDLSEAAVPENLLDPRTWPRT